MKTIRILAGAGLLATAAFAAAMTEPPSPTQPPAARVHECAAAELAGVNVDYEQAKSHRKFQFPVLHYPPGQSPPNGDWQLLLKLRVEPDGRIACYHLEEVFRKPELDARRQALIDQLAGWRYEPILREGKPAVAVVSERVLEQEDPPARKPMPKFDLADVELRMSRSGCFGTCPSYTIVLHGDGRASYAGSGFVDVEGKHEYKVPVADVARLVDLIQREDVWSAKSEYRAPITDNPTTRLYLRLGSDVHEIEDYVGLMVGMPDGVKRVEDEIDRIGRTDDWLQLSMFAIENLQREGFDFHSKVAGELLTRAVRNEGGSRPGVIERLIALGAPSDLAVESGWMRTGGSTLEAALAAGRFELVDALVARGALDVAGKRSQEKLDSAFREAIRGGRLEGVEAIWTSHGNANPPSLFYDEPASENSKLTRKTSVLLLLERPYPRERQWDAIKIASWLRAQGADINSRSVEGSTLLFAAASGGDAGFVRWLLDAGVDPNVRGQYQLTALGSADAEEVALALLEHGADPAANDKDGSGPPWRQYAEANGWGRVLAWLDAHPATRAR